MNGLASKQPKRFLDKYAMEGTKENNVKQLISEEAYSQLSKSFPELIGYIVGIKIIEIFDDNSALGGAVLFNNNEKIIIPIVYSNGKVDATTFIYNQEKDVILALTKKVSKMLTMDTPNLNGSVVSLDDGSVNIDSGNINKVFIPPKTYAPKIASHGGILFAVLEKYASIREKVISDLKDPEKKESFVGLYGEEGYNAIINMGIEKVASDIDDSSPEVVFSIRELKGSGWKEMQAAINEFSRNGFAISHGVNAQPFSLKPITTLASRIKEISGDDALEGINTRDPGVYTVYSIDDLRPLEIVVSNFVNSNSGIIVSRDLNRNKIDINDVDDGNPIVGKKIKISDSNTLLPFSYFSFEPNKKVLVFLKGDSIFGVEPISFGDDVREGLSTTTIERSFSPKIQTIKIEKNSNAEPIVFGNTLFVGDNNVRVIDESCSVESNSQTSIVRMRDLDVPSEEVGDIVKVAYDGVEYTYNNNVYSRQSLVQKLLDDGFEKNSIYSLVKTASEQGNAEFASVNAKIDMLANMVMNLAGKVDTLRKGLETIQQPQSYAQQTTDDENGSNTDDSAQSQDKDTQQSQQAVNGTALPDQNAGMPPSDEELAAQNQQYADQVSQDQQFLSQTPNVNPYAQQQDNGDNQSQGLQDGMNTAIDPDVLNTLSALKDSKIMDIGALSSMTIGEDIAPVVRNYSGDILNGASAIGRILLNAMLKENSLIDDMGQKNYDKFVKSLRTVFKSTSDLYIDIIKMEFETNGKVESDSV